jgi:osmotically-inducible protein OsmY
VRSRAVTEDECRSLEISAQNGAALLSGNVRTKRSVETLDALAASVPGVEAVSVEIADDVSLESDVAGALYRSGLSRSAAIYPRSALGRVTLYGRAPSTEAAAEAMRVASRVPGVRSVNDRLEVLPAQLATA